jgi:hypothetical protein
LSDIAGIDLFNEGRPGSRQNYHFGFWVCANVTKGRPQLSMRASTPAQRIAITVERHLKNPVSTLHV